MGVRAKALQKFFGNTVHVQVDRPVGYVHKGLVYPVNYGYIPGMPAGDGEDQDVYILGVSEPLTAFDGVVIGAVNRRNDVEDKLVVAPAGKRLHQGQIADAVRFQERFFDSVILAAFQKSCGVIPWRLRNGEKEYLVLLQKNGSWSFPKGHMEAGETEEMTALRELFEETGLRAMLDTTTPVSMEYEIPPNIRKQVVLFLGQTEGQMALQQSEITGAKWVRAERLREYLHPDTWSACRHLLK